MNVMQIDKKPWYREPWPWILMSGPAVVVVAGVFTAWLAVRSSDGLVEDDYYKKGLAVNQSMARDQEAVTRGLVASLMLGADRDLRVLLSSRAEFDAPEVLVLRVVHPTRAGSDQSVELKRGSDGMYHGRLNAPLSGRWHLQLEDDQHHWRLVGDWHVDSQPATRLQAGASQSDQRRNHF